MEPHDSSLNISYSRETGGYFNIKGNLVNERSQNNSLYCYNSTSLGADKETDRWQGLSYIKKSEIMLSKYTSFPRPALSAKIPLIFSLCNVGRRTWEWEPAQYYLPDTVRDTLIAIYSQGYKVSK